MKEEEKVSDIMIKEEEKSNVEEFNFDESII